MKYLRRRLNKLKTFFFLARVKWKQVCIHKVFHFFFAHYILRPSNALPNNIIDAISVRFFSANFLRTFLCDCERFIHVIILISPHMRAYIQSLQSQFCAFFLSFFFYSNDSTASDKMHYMGFYRCSIFNDTFSTPLSQTIFLVFVP